MPDELASEWASATLAIVTYPLTALGLRHLWKIPGNCKSYIADRHLPALDHLDSPYVIYSATYLEPGPKCYLLGFAGIEMPQLAPYVLGAVLAAIVYIVVYTTGSILQKPGRHNAIP